MKKKILLLLDGDQNTSAINSSLKYLKDRYDIEVTGLYIKELEEKLAPVNPYIGEDIIDEYLKLEDDIVVKIKSNIKNLNVDKIVIREGLAVEEVLNEMLAHDILIIDGKRDNEYRIKSILKAHFKPMIIIKDRPLNFNSVFLANDKGMAINKSVSLFMSLFNDVKNLKSISVNNRTKVDRLVDYFEGSKVEYRVIPFEGNPQSIIGEVSKDYTFMIMGNLHNTGYLEVLGGHFGSKILDEVEVPIFIG